MTDEVPIEIQRTQRWFEQAVLGLGLCPFAAEPWNTGRIRFVVSHATTEELLLVDLRDEMISLGDADPQNTETTVLIVAEFLHSFEDYNQFLGQADQLVEDSGWSGEFQIASFHPAYQFADTTEDDVSNLTNRSPYPLLHVLRESSVSKAVDGHPDPQQIPTTNIETLQNLTDEQRQKIFDFLP